MLSQYQEYIFVKDMLLKMEGKDTVNLVLAKDGSSHVFRLSDDWSIGYPKVHRSWCVPSSQVTTMIREAFLKGVRIEALTSTRAKKLLERLEVLTSFQLADVVTQALLSQFMEDEEMFVEMER